MVFNVGSVEAQVLPLDLIRCNESPWIQSFNVERVQNRSPEDIIDIWEEVSLVPR